MKALNHENVGYTTGTLHHESRNAEFIRRFNSGVRFSIVFTAPREWAPKICVATNWENEGDLHYALVVLPIVWGRYYESDDAAVWRKSAYVLPYPIFEEAAGIFFKKEEIQGLNQKEEKAEVYATEGEFVAWLLQNFGEAFGGLIESWSGSLEDRERAKRFASWVSRDLRSYRPKDIVSQINWLEYQAKIQRDRGWSESPSQGTLGTLMSVIKHLRGIRSEDN